ncbi:MAG TPA: low molecular weight protein-tyrosine-phosphatase [Thermoanaerobaculia bacterium]|nr:low molecular weight protein-tyrosine-phosphatase [Thermoanaerobaculia bacterium]
MPTTRRVLFVCLGNICRSPTAEGILRAELERRGHHDRVEVDSAGTGGWHVGDAADPRMRRAASARGYDLTSRARQVTAEDFQRFDLIVAMDRQNLADLEQIAPPPAERRADLRLFSSFLPYGGPEDVPDPYYGGPDGFDHVIDLIEEAAAAIADHLAGDGTVA